jgi:hypothetical protein
MCDLSKVKGERWKTLADAKKQKYVKLGDKDKTRFEKENAELKEKGYFVNSDGVKSTDIKLELKDFPKDTVMPKRVPFPVSFYLKKWYKKF